MLRIRKLTAVAILGAGLALGGCPSAPKPAAQAPPVDKTPLSQPVSINLNFLGVVGQEDPEPEFLAHADPDELRLFPIRFPVANWARMTKIDPSKDKLKFMFAAMWGRYKNEAQLVVLEPGKSASADFKLADATLNIRPVLVKPDQGYYELTLTLESGEQMGKFRVEGWGEHVGVKGAAKTLSTRQVYSDKVRRITGYQVCHPGDIKHPQQGVIFMGEGWTTDNEYLLAKWANEPRIFPEVDVQVYPEYWFTMRDIVRSCHTIKAEPLGSPLSLPAGYAGFGGGRCYG